MVWTAEECARFERDGFVLSRRLLEADAIARLRAQVPAILATRDDGDGMHREFEKSGAARQVYLAHRHHEGFRALAHDPRLTGPVRQLLGEDLHIYHSKINVKAGLEGAVWLWHQDYCYWTHDGVEPRLISSMVLLDRATLLTGALLVVPGSHRWGALPHHADTVTTSYRQWCVPTETLRARLREEEIVAITGEPGDVLHFDCRLLHGSGHNMAPHDRTTFIVVYNQRANRPQRVANPRPDWVVDRTFAPVI